MPLTLIVGGANSGKTGEVFRRVEAAVDRRQPAVLILPTSADVRWVRRELSLKRPLGVTVTRFDAYLQTLWPARGDGRRIVTPVQRGWLLRRCAVGLGMPEGSAVTAARVVDRAAGAAGEAWRSVVLGGHGPLGELLALYAATLASRNLVEPGEAVNLLAESGMSAPSRSAIFFHHFTDFTEAQERFIRGAAADGADVLVSLTWTDGHPATASATRFVERFAGEAQVVDMGPNDVTATEGELRRLAMGLFTTTVQQRPEGCVSFSSAEGDEAEASQVAADVQALVDEGFSPERIAVVFRDIRSRAGALRRALARVGLPVDVDAPLPVALTPFGRALWALVRFLDGDGREALFTWVRSGYAGDVELAARLERRWRQGGTWDRERLTSDLRSLGVWQPGLVRTAGSAEPGRRVPVEAWGELLDRMFAERWAGRVSADEAVRIDAAARSAAAEVLSGVTAMGEAGLSAHEFSEALRTATVAPMALERPGHVQIMGVDRVRGRRFDAVVLGGLNEGEFPRCDDEALASEEVRGLLRACGAREVRPAEGERTLLYEAVTRARHRLVVCRRVTDAEGRPLPASIFWEELRDLYRSPDVGQDRAGLPSGLDRYRSLGEVLGGEVSQATASQAPHDVVAARAAREEPSVGRCRRRGPAALPVADHDLIEEDVLRRRLADRVSFSARELELYAQCPRRWLVEHELRPSPVDQPVDARVKGAIVHDALARAFRALREEGTPRVTPDVEGRLPTLVKRAAEEALDASEVPKERRQGLAPWVRSRVLRSLRADAEALAGFEPELLEHSLGDGSTDGVDLGAFVLRGRVDRVDRAPDGRFVVLEYKSGTVQDRARTHWETAPHLQAGLYALAVERSLGGSPVGCLYRGLADGKTRGAFDAMRCPGQTLVRTDAVDDFAELLRWVLVRSQAAADGIRAGRVEPVPGDHCEHCVAASFCAVGGTQ